MAVVNHCLLIILFCKLRLLLSFLRFRANLLSACVNRTTGDGREVWMEDILGRPNRRAEEEEHGEGF
jgi:hypothetical protein